MKKSTQINLNYIAWTLSFIVVFLAIYVWGSNLAWNFGDISLYQIFPIFGLIAFSVMWSHYVISLLNKTVYKGVELKAYYSITGYIVLISILFHPDLLAFQRFRDGFGLPEGSLISYVQPSLKWVVLLGTVSLLTFISFELHRWFKNKSWWKYVVYLNEIAMLAIFYHALKLGSNLHGGWYMYVWYLYGIVLISIFAFYYANRLKLINTLKNTNQKLF